MKRKILFAIALVLIVAMAFGINYFSQFQKYEAIMEDIEIGELSLVEVEDGVYKGSFNAYLVAADVEVRIIDHQIEAIKLVNHKNERGSDAEVIPERVVEAQSLDVDVVSGASNSSRVILKAIENAFVK